jgi:peptidoglycan/LPS O-acetylase OafA/YrhL
MLFNAGWIGVQLFFVLSGFLITTNLLESREAPNYYRAFFGRRVLRIFPLYFAVLVASYWIMPALGLPGAPSPAEQHDQIWYWTFLSNWAIPLGLMMPWVLSHFWSLAVEEQFYFVWPFVVRRFGGALLVRLSVALMVIAIACRIALVLGGAPRFTIYEFTFCRMDALVAGAAMAVLVRREREGASRPRWLAFPLASAIGILLFGAVVTPAYGRDYPANQIAGHSLLALSFALTILAVTSPTGGAQAGLARLLSLRPLRSIGKYSYAMYVFHQPLAIALVPLAGGLRGMFAGVSVLVWIAGVGVLSYIFGLVSYHAFEKRFLNLKDRFVPALPEGVRVGTSSS